MIITILVTVCHLMGSTPVCADKVVTDSQMQPELNMMACTIGSQAIIADWKAKHPVYSREEYVVQKYGCVFGDHSYQLNNEI